MRLDKFSNPVFNEDDLFDAIYQGHDFTTYKPLIIERRTQDITNLENCLGYQFQEPFDNVVCDIEGYDTDCQNDWKMPEDYKNVDIEKLVLDSCSNPEELIRAQQELLEFKKRNMLDLLRWLKYFVDNCLKNNIIFGVGRGSSVASFVLYKIGVHSIDPIKYNLDWQEFLR